jgi:hypothetical protein
MHNSNVVSSELSPEKKLVTKRSKYHFTIFSDESITKPVQNNHTVSL